MADRSISIDENSESPEANAAPVLIERRANKVDRRKVTLWSFIRGGLEPRRRSGRRSDDRTAPIDWHDPYLLFLALLMLLLSVADAFFTITLLTKGAEEANPLLAFILNEHPELFAIAKMLLTGFGILVLVALARGRLLGVVSGRFVFQALAFAYLVLVAYEFWMLGALD